MFDVVNKNVQLHISVTGHTDRPSTNWRERDDNTARDLVGLPFIEHGRRSFRHALSSQARHATRTAQLGATRASPRSTFNYRRYSLADRALSSIN